MKKVKKINSKKDLIKQWDRERKLKLLFCIIGGPLGIHYWYTKRYLRAILFLLTRGGFGIWYVYDIVKIIIDSNYLSRSKKKKVDIENKSIESDKKIIDNNKAKIENTYNKIDTNIKKQEDLELQRRLDEHNQLMESIYEELNINLIDDAEKYLEAFNDINSYNLSKELDENFLKKITRTKEVDYEKFMKPSGTTNRPMNFVVFDLETTGLSEIKNEIIEIGAIRFDTNKPVEKFHTFIKPKKKITARITSINGITNEMVENCPTIEEVLPKFIDFIGEDVLIAHNSNFDMKFILHQMYIQNYKKPKNKVIDTLKLSRQKIRRYDYEKDRSVKLDSYKLESLKNDFGLWDIGSHNAIDDCKVCAYVYLKIENRHDDFCYVTY